MSRHIAVEVQHYSLVSPHVLHVWARHQHEPVLLNSHQRDSPVEEGVGLEGVGLEGVGVGGLLVFGFALINFIFGGS